MKKYIVLLTVAFFTIVSHAQLSDSGSKFDFDPRKEMEPQFVLCDNYNHYLLTIINTNGMLAERKMILRKFDQNNQLVNTYSYDFPKFDIATLYNYLGAFETKDGKVIVITETYSGKAKKSDIVKHEFDKASAKFTSTAITSTAILSASKSGTVRLEVSQNGAYAGIVTTKYRAKGEAEKNAILLLDRTTATTVWEKEAEFTNEHTTQAITVTNSGKVVLLRESKGFKKENNNNYLAVVSATGQEDRNFESPIFLQQPKAISIGTQDYIVAFNSKHKALRQSDFTNILFYDLQSGRTLQNLDNTDFTAIKNLNDVTFRNIAVQNNEIHLFAEAKVEAGTKPSTGFSASSFPETAYKMGPAYLYIWSLEGTIKATKKLKIDSDAQQDVSNSYGLLNIMGDYYISAGNTSGLYAVTPANNYEPSAMLLRLGNPEPRYNEGINYIDQLVHYFPDSKKIIFARLKDNKTMTIVSAPAPKQ